MAKTATVNAWIREDNLDGQDMVEALRHIANLIEQGYTSGHYPTWELVINDEENDNEVQNTENNS
jgi:hypothetical protein